MPTNTPEYDILIQAHNSLKALYLVGRQGTVASPAEQEFARCFIVFMHAEIEYYFERVCIRILAALKSQLATNQVSQAHIGILSYAKIEKGEPFTAGEFLAGTKARKSLGRIYKAIGDHIKIVDENHGIRQKYLAPLFVPLGLTNENIDPDWIGAIDTVAEKRGAFAHKSRMTGEGRPDGIEPTDFDEYVNRVIFGAIPIMPGYISSIREFDAWVVAACAGTVSYEPIRLRSRARVLHIVGWSLLRLLARIPR